MAQNDIHLRFDHHSGGHSQVTLFMRGGNVGHLTMTPAEAIWFHHILDKGARFLKFNFVSSGMSPQPDPKDVDKFAQDVSI